MIRIAGVILPSNKHIWVALRSIFGIGRTKALGICSKVGIDPSIKVSDLKEDIAVIIQQAVQEIEVEGDVRRRVAVNIKRLRDIKCYRGLRHRLGVRKGVRVKKRGSSKK